VVEIKLETREILFRVLYLGRAESTKFETFRSLKEKLGDSGDRVGVLHAGGDRIITFRHRPEGDAQLFGMEIAVDAVAIVGDSESSANETLLLRAADGIVWIDDGVVGEDVWPVVESLHQSLRRLEVLRRSPADLPLFIQGRDKTLRNRSKDYRRGIDAWRPNIRVLSDNVDSASIFKEIETHILNDFRGYERELSRHGLTDHIKIRDRIYEKVCLSPAFPKDDAPKKVDDRPEMRLIGSQDSIDHGDIPRRWIIVTLLVAIASAVATSLIL